ncbi:hypothetical protein EH165_14590 [Nakamurella antarctica]|uniref:Uncharacterized protein n=1 Tax=Nakamurella antarctica TaxID=1902245 RepID=A0A3G8ZQV0_9ACTN|nr:hypothetical protein [Nakamurella antarctica]AZI59185.1 hypothetical protein EH165_14590 [Nakamurella antarctica]
MYQLETSSGFSASIANPELITAALADELSRSGVAQPMRWTVTTPHGTTVTDTIYDGGDANDRVRDPIDRAYGLLVRDVFTSGRHGGRHG